MASVMLVDDDVELAEAIEAWLRREHSVAYAPSVEAALAELREGMVPDVVVTDYDLGTHNSKELLEVLTLCYPSVCRILFTGTPRWQLSETAALAHHVLDKCSVRDLIDRVSECAPHDRAA